jgi:hypothetical protein
MKDEQDQLARYSTLAVESAAKEIGVRPIDLARRLTNGEIARMLALLNAALRHVEHAALRHRIEDALLSVTDGRMPSESPESELDWALKVNRHRRSPDEG